MTDPDRIRPGTRFRDDASGHASGHRSDAE